jgi:dTDP-4-dehydrorhamnose 3,5-epimerase
MYMSNLFELRETTLAGVKIVKRIVRSDTRGSFSRMFCAAELQQAGWLDAVAQINFSRTSQPGTVRGLHYQRGNSAEDKLISCITGAVWDVAVDLRPNSPTYLHWHAERLDSINALAMLIPKGVAHGFQVLEANSSLLYVHSSPYSPMQEAGLRADDPRLAIAWPLGFQEWSERDRNFPLLDAGQLTLFP